jgi:exopolysaccharide production protein ExoQ
MPHFPAASLATSDHSAESNVLVHLLFAIGMMIVMPMFVLQLAADPVTLQFTNSRVLQFGNILTAMFAVAMIAWSVQAVKIAMRCWPLLVLLMLAYLSSIWSYDVAATIRGCNTFLIASLLGVAMASRLSPASCIRLIVRTLTFACLLSIIWVILFPQEGMHQATDAYQNQHAGLWRGVFSHKQGLGVVAGLTTGLLASYGSIVFRSPLLRIAAFVCGVSCLVGSGSATGLLISIVLPATSYVNCWIGSRPPALRNGTMTILMIVIGTAYALFHVGALDFIMPLLGKSEDLTGRADFWPWVMSNIRNSGPILGGGFASGWEVVVAPSMSIDNGYIQLLVGFGYLGTAIVLAMYVRTLLAAIRLVVADRPESVAIRTFPFVIIFIELFLNITEATFMTKSIHTVLIAVAICQIARLDKIQARVPATKVRPAFNSRGPG